MKDVTLVIGAFSCSEFGESPRWATVTVNDAFLDTLGRLARVCSENQLQSVTLSSYPDGWGGASDVRLSSCSLVVWTRGDFWFRGEVKHADYAIETHAIGIGDLVNACNGDSLADDRFHHRNGILFFAPSASEANALADDVCSEFVIHSASEEAASDGGFWSNEHGWTGFEDATRFTAEEAESVSLPISTSNDARIVPACLWDPALAL